jgi:hypothetical protein
MINGLENRTVFALAEQATRDQTISATTMANSIIEWIDARSE